MKKFGKFWSVTNGIVALGAFIGVIGMVFFDYEPSKMTVIFAFVIVGLDSIGKMIDARTEYWQGQVVRALKERENL